MITQYCLNTSPKDQHFRNFSAFDDVDIFFFEKVLFLYEYLFDDVEISVFARTIPNDTYQVF